MSKKYDFGALFKRGKSIEQKVYSSDSNQQAKNKRSQIAKLPNVIGVTQIIKPSDQMLPAQIKVIIRKGAEDGR